LAAAVKLLRLIPIRMATSDLRANHAILLKQLRWSAGRVLSIPERGQLFIPADDETFSVAMCVCNPDRSSLVSIVETQPQLQPALLRLSAMISQYFI
jgi:hypothetical protein